MPPKRPLLAATALTLLGFMLMVGFENAGVEAWSSQLQLQFAWTAEQARAVLERWGEAGSARVSYGLYADFLFLIGYTALLLQLLRAWRQPRWLAWGALLAGGLDVLENVFILGFIQGLIDLRFALLVSLMATLKFSLIFIALFHLIGHYTRRGERA